MRPPNDEMASEESEMDNIIGSSENIDTYVAIADYNSEADVAEDLSLHEGQLVEVLDSHNSQRWLIRTKSTPPEEGWVPSNYLEHRGKPGLEKKDSRELPKEAAHRCVTREQEALEKRETVLEELIETEKDFIKSLKFVISTYVREFDNPHVPESLRTLRDDLFIILKEILTFHESVLLSGLQYVGDVAKVGKTFLRLERDFDKHVAYCRDEPEAQTLLASSEAEEYLLQFSQRIGDTDRTLSDYLKLPIQRINKYQLLLKELIKYTARAKEDCSEFQKALDLMMSIPMRAHDLTYLNSVEGYRGNIQKLGRLLRHDSFVLWETEAKGPGKERYLFLFRDRILVTKKEGPIDMPEFVYKDTIKLAEVSFKEQITDDEKRFEFVYYPEFKKPSIIFQAKTPYIKQAWIKEMKELLRTRGGLVELEEIEEEKTPIFIMEVAAEDDNSDTNNRDSAEYFMAPEYEDGTTRPRFKKTTEKVTCIEHETVRFDCKVAGVPKPSVTWMRGGRPIELSEKFVSVQEEETHIFYIKNTVLDDAGYYKARALNINGAISFKAELVVIGGDLKRMIVKRPSRPCTPLGVPIEEDVIPRRPFFETGMKSIGVQVGESAQFKIKVGGFPEPEIKWQRSTILHEKGRLNTSERYHEKEVIKHSEKFRIIRDTEESATLIIENVTIDDTGRYFCEAINELGSVTSQGQLLVEGFDSMMKYDSDYKEELIEVERGEILKIEVGFDGSPMPKASWMCNGRLLYNTERVTIEVVENVARLIINNTEDSDAGTYTLILETDIEKVSIPIIVNVVEPPPGKSQSIRKSESLRKIETFESSQTERLVETSTGGKDIERYDSITTSEFSEKTKISQGKSTTELNEVISKKDREIIQNAEDSEIVEILKEYEIVNGIKESEISETQKEISMERSDYTETSETKEVKGSDLLETEKTGRSIQIIKKDEVLEMEEDYDSSKETEKEFEFIETETEIETKKYFEDIESLKSEEESESKEYEVIETKIKSEIDEVFSDSELIETVIKDKKESLENKFEIIETEKWSGPREIVECELGEIIETVEKIKKFQREFQSEDSDSIEETIKESIVTQKFPESPDKEIVRDIKIQGSFEDYEISETGKQSEFNKFSKESEIIERFTDSQGTIKQEKYEITETKTAEKVQQITSEVVDRTEVSEREDMFDYSFDKRYREREFGPPGPPIEFQVIDVTPDSVTLRWRPPNFDGGSMIYGYIVEKRGVGRQTWNRAVVSKELSCTVQNLLEDNEYEFSVSAENEYGLGDRAETLSIVAKYPFGVPEPPSQPRVQVISNNSAVLTWTPPEKDGGSPVIGYYAERKHNYSTQWIKMNREMVVDPAYNVVDMIKDANYEFRIIAINKAGESIPGIPSLPVKAIAPLEDVELGDIIRKPAPTFTDDAASEKVPPSYTFDEMYLEEIKLAKGELLKLQVQTKGNPVPKATWSFGERRLSDSYLISIDTTRERTTLKVRNVTKADSGPYNLNLENEVGKAQAQFSVQVLDVPGPPRNIRVVEGTDDSVTLAWEPPEDDGGATIEGYFIEKRGIGRRTWQKVDATEETVFTIPNLVEGNDYEFRIAAENMFGLGEPMDMRKTITVRYTFHEPGPPTNATIIRVSADSVVITWMPPNTDGGSPVLGYYIERRQGISPRWIRISKERINDNVFEVIGLQTGEAYEFRVIAENKAGESRPSMPTDQIVTVDQSDFYQDDIIKEIISVQSEEDRQLIESIEASRIEKNIEDNQIVRDLSPETSIQVPPKCIPKNEIVCIESGDTFAIDVSIEGDPTPKVYWYLNGKPLLETYRITIEKTQTSSSINIRETSKDDAGVYKIVLESNAGKAEASITAKVLDVPDSPTNVKVQEITNDSVTLQWEPPKDDGGSEIIGYLIEKRGTGRRLFQKVTTTQETTYTVTDLIEDNFYDLQVTAVNKYGTGNPVEVGPIRINFTFSQPAEVGPPSVERVTGTTAVISWNKPSDNGGTILGYYIERRASISPRWMRITKERITDTKYEVSGLVEGEEYEFRIIAENRAGESKPGIPCEPIIAIDSIVEPVTEQVNKITTEDVRESQLIKETVEDSEVIEEKRIEETKVVQKTVIREESTVEEVRETSFSQTTHVKEEEEMTGILDESIITEEALVSIQPSPPAVERITATSALLTWQAPPNRAVLGYHIEQRKGIETVWMRITKERLSDTSYLVENLEVDEEYQFRIISETELGESKPSEPSKPMKAKETFVEQTRESISITEQIKVEQTTEVVRESITTEEAITSIQPGPPLVQRISSTSALLTWQASPNKAVLGYHIEQRKGIETTWMRITKERLSDTSYLVENLDEDEEYQFRIIAQSEVGESKPSEPSQPIKAKETLVEKLTTSVAEKEETQVLTHTTREEKEETQFLTHTTREEKVPSTPLHPIVKSITSESAVISWEEPIFESDSPLSGYYVEKRRPASSRWMRVTKKRITNTTYEVPDLIEGEEYEFRVIAESEDGETITSIPTKPILATEVSVTPGSPTIPIVSDITAESALISWEAPEDDGGSPVTGYYVEKRSGINTRWIRVTREKIKANSFNVRDLIVEEEYQFRVIAENNAGEGEPSEPSEPIIARNPPGTEREESPVDQKMGEPPSFVLRDHTVEIQSGETLKLQVKYYGEPEPEIIWLFNGQPVKESNKIRTITTNEEAIIQVKSVENTDAGEYTIKLVNDLGFVEAPITVKVLDVPSAPSNLQVTEITGESVTIKWEKPKEDGGKEVTEYIVEKRGAGRRAWQKVATTADFTYTVPNLIENEEYEFQVSAVNEFGSSEPAFVGPIVPQSSDIGVPPSAPSKPIVSDVTTISATLTWQPPTDDGDIPITGYVVERRTGARPQWIRVTRERINKTSFTITDLEQGETYEFRVIAINEKGESVPSEPSEAFSPLLPSGVAPSVTLETDTIEILAGETLKLQVRYSGEPEPEVTWLFNGQPIDESNRIKTTNENNVARIQVRGVENLDAGVYTIKIKNHLGVVEAPITVKVIDIPSTPSNLQVTEVTGETVTLEWEPPENDGGSEVTEYIVEKRGIGRRTWQKVATTADLIFIVPNLIEDAEYEFQVTAVNDVGPSEPAFVGPILAQYSDIIDSPGAPSRPEITEITTDSATFSWQSPSDDGGAPILGYVIERRSGISPKWIRITREKITKRTYTATELEQNESYEFRVIAINQIGEGSPSEPSEVITPLQYEEDITPKKPAGIYPSFTLETDKVEIQSGETLKLNVRYDGEPEPEVTWLFNGLPVEDSNRIKTTSEDNVATIQVRYVENLDAGVYTVRIKNNLGAVEAPITVIVLDVPSAPTNLDVTEITGESVTLQWEPPLDDGGREVIEYLVEKRGAGRKTWQKVDTTSSLTLTVPNLIEDNEYEFQVSAVNEFGPSEPAFIGPIVPQYSEICGPPGAPSRPEIYQITTVSTTFNWEAPSDDGGTPIIGYVIEQRPFSSYEWIRITHEKISQRTFTATELEKDESYEFRVIAINQTGEGSPSESSDSIRLLDFEEECIFEKIAGTPPGAPSKPVVYDITSDSATLTWKPPADDGGVPIIGYIIEQRTGISTEWYTISIEIIENTSFTVTELKQGETYEVCVTAVNKLGEGLPSEASDVFSPLQARGTPPGQPSRPIVSDINSDSVVLTWKPPTETGGLPIHGYHIEIKSESTNQWVKISREKVTNTTFKVQGLRQRETYEFRIIAVNQIGEGTPSEPSDSITLPQTEANEVPETPESVQPGGNLPGPPSNLTVFNVTPENVSLKWDIPEDDGGNPITGYIVKTLIHGETEWLKIDNVTNTTVTVPNLTKDTLYDFEVCAKNQVGVGSPSYVGPVAATYPFATPGAPSKPLVSHITADSAQLSWEPPLNDGGSPILGYFVEQRQAITTQWMRITREKIETTSYHVTSLQEGQQYEFRIVAVNKAGEGKPSEPSDLITAKGEELIGVPPDYSLAAKYRDLVTVDKGDILKLDIPFTGDPTPSANWRFGNKMISESGRVKIDSDDNRAKIKIKEMDIEDTGVYTLTLENTAGRVEVPVRVKVLDVPAPPKNLQVTETTPESAGLKWEAPDDDGGCPITGYVIQRRTAERPSWQRIASTTQTSFTVPNLLDGGEYYFQVLAENDLGLSEPAETGKVIAKYKFNEPGKPGTPIVSNITNDSAVLNWEPPKTDGGSPLLGYLIEQRSSNNQRWIKITKQTISFTTYKLTSLIEDIEYEYRIIAVNKAGESVPSESCPPFKITSTAPEPIEEISKVESPKEEIEKVKLPQEDVSKVVSPKEEIPKVEPPQEDIPKVVAPKEEIQKVEPPKEDTFKPQPIKEEIPHGETKPAGVAPEYTLDAQYKDGIVIEKGQLLKLDVSYTGIPQPILIWKDNRGQVLSEAYRVRIENYENITKLKVKEISKQDEGVYTLTLENAFGKVECPISVKVADVPSPPKNLKAIKITPQTVTLQWQTPDDDGGSPILGYVVEKKGAGRRAWQRIQQTRDLTYEAFNLLEGKEYEFRVMAENIYGLSEPVESESIIAKWQFGKPGAPGTPEVSGVTKESATITWEAPKEDGGSPIIGYHVEKRQGISPRWIRISKERIPETEFEAWGLIEGEEYQFRVIAENKAGEGEPSQPSKAIVAQSPIVPKDTLDEVRPVDDEFIESAKPRLEEEIPEGATKPQFWRTIDDISCFEGETVKFECEVTGFPKPVVFWLKDQVAIIPSDEVRYISKGDVYALIFKEAYKEDTGHYTVVAENIKGSVECSAEMDVKSSQIEEEPMMPGPEPPVFKKGMKDKEALEGTTPRFELKVTGYPRPAIKWFKDGEEITMTPNVNFKVIIDPEGSITTTIDNVNPEDAGKYTCVASNYLGEAKTEGKLKVIEKPRKIGEPEKPPVFLQPLKDIEVIEGNPARFECHVAGNPHPDAVWSQEDHIIHSSSEFRTFSEGQKCVLNIRSALPEDAGVYSVHISNPLGEARSKAKLTVKDDPNKKKVIRIPPRFIQRFTDIEVVNGNECKFECSVTGDPKPEITWYFNRRPLRSGSYRKIYQDGEYNALVVLEVGKEDRGEFICKAFNAAGEATCTAELSVIDAKTISHDRESPPKDIKGVAPTFARKPRDCEALEGKEAFFDCRVLGTPDPVVQWVKTGIELEPSDRIHFDKEYGGRHAIRISRLELQDAGEYSCIATNFAGRVSASAELRVDVPRTEMKFPDSDTKWKPPEYIEHDRRKEDRGGAPWPIPDAPIISHNTDRHLRLSWKPSLPVAPRYSPISYIIEMCELPGKDWYTVKTGVRNPVCDIGLLQPGVDYKFRIRAENMYGISDPSPSATTLRDKLEPNIPKPYVQRRPEMGVRLEYAPKIPDIWRPEHEGFAAPPKFFRPEYDTQFGIDGEQVEIETWVYGYPTPEITWHFNNKKLELSGRYGSSLLRTGQCILIIDKMMWDDVGEYECTAVNEHGDASIIVKLEMADPPVFIEPCIDTLILNNESGRLDCRVTGVPYPEIKWLKDWHPLCASTRIKIKQDEPDHCSLIINDAITRDSGLYTCQAKNLAGTALCSVTVHVESQAPFDYSQEDVSYRKVRTKRRRAADAYDIGDEIGRGTTAVVKRATEKATGHEYAAKIIHSKPSDLLHMKREIDIMNLLNDKRLIRLHDAYERGESLTLIQELATGGELLDNLSNQQKLTEREIADYIRQLLQAIAHMHEKNIVYIDLKPEDILLSSPNSRHIKLCDFGLAHRLHISEDLFVPYGTPEFTAPEIAKKYPVKLPADLWSAGVLTYLLLSGISPFLGDTDKETLENVIKGEWDFDRQAFSKVSDDAKDFIRRLLVIDYSKRMTAHQALDHPWLKRTDDVVEGLPLDLNRLRAYNSRRKSQLGKSEVSKFARRRKLSSCLRHPEGKLYPPEAEPDRDQRRYIERRSSDTPKEWMDLILSTREPGEHDFVFQSESMYQQGPDTDLLQLRDPHMPVRIRQYMRLSLDPTQSAYYKIKAEQLAWGEKPAVKERRRILELLEEEEGLIGRPPTIEDRLAARRRKRQAIKEPEGYIPYFREKLRDKAFFEDRPVTFKVYVIGNPPPKVSWYRNDVILSSGERIKIVDSDSGRYALTILHARSGDVGVYKCVARNRLGESVCRSRLRVGSVPDRPPWPEVPQVSSTEAYVTWDTPRFDGNSPIEAYKVEFRESNDERWTVGADSIEEELLVVKDLEPLKKYRFRVAARNVFGWSPYTFSSEEIVTLHEGAPRLTIDKTRRIKPLQHHRRPTRQLSTGSISVSSSRRSSLDYTVEEHPRKLNESNPEEKYRFSDEIRRGRFSVIRICTEKSSDRICAAKIIDLANQDRTLALQEFEAMKALCNEHIIHFYDAFLHNDFLTLILERIRGCDILQFLSQKDQYTEEDVAQIITQVLDALQYLHFNGISHLNLQPDNVVTVSRRRIDIRLIDFGNACQLPAEGEQLGRMVGHPEYMAPEVANKELITYAADVWGVGVLAFIMLSGHSPFRGDDDRDTLNNVLLVRYRFQDLFSHITMESVRFIMQTLKRSPYNRPTVEECLDHKWLQPIDSVIRKQQRAIFITSRIRRFEEEYRRQQDKVASNNNRLLSQYAPSV